MYIHISYTSNHLELTTDQYTRKLLDFCLWNARSIKNKSLALKDYIVDHDLDFLALTETWLRSGDIDNYHIEEFCPTGYVFHHIPRSISRGGGVGLLIKKLFHVKKQSVTKFDSFEYMDVLVKHLYGDIRILVMYRPPLRGQNSSIENNFFNDFSTLAEQLATAPGSLAIVGDLNLHMDDSCNANAKKFHDILESFNLKQHVSLPTHNRGHILDLIITRAEDCLVSDIVVKDPVLSDHLAVHCKLKLKKLPAERREVSFRKLKSININSMREDLKSSTVIMDAYTDLSGLINTYEHELKRILDTHAPKKSRMITIRPLASWYDNSINVEKRKRRKLERR